MSTRLVPSTGDENPIVLVQFLYTLQLLSLLFNLNLSNTLIYRVDNGKVMSCVFGHTVSLVLCRTAPLCNRSVDTTTMPVGALVLTICYCWIHSVVDSWSKSFRL